MAVFSLPVPGDAARHLPQDPTAQIRHLDPGQDEKTRVVGHQLQMALPLSARPTDELVARLTLPSRRCEHQASQGTALSVAHDIVQVLSHRAAKTQIVKPGQRFFDPSPWSGLAADFLHTQR